MTKLGIIGAMTQEVETLVESMAECTSKEIAGSTFYEGTLDGLPAVIVQCGVGKVRPDPLLLLFRHPFGEHRHCRLSEQ